MICEKCGGSIAAENAKFCPRCGAPVKKINLNICKTCGKSLPDSTARFCPFCGSGTQEDEKVVLTCPECGREYDDGFLYCEDCGRKLQGKQPRPTVLQSEVSERLNGITYYQGEPKLSAKGILGNLHISSRQIVFKVIFGGPLNGGFLAAGKEIVFEMAQVRAVRTGKYGGVFTTLVFETLDGKTYTFVPSVPGNSAPIEKAVNVIKQCM